MQGVAIVFTGLNIQIDLVATIAGGHNMGETNVPVQENGRGLCARGGVWAGLYDTCSSLNAEICRLLL